MRVASTQLTTTIADFAGNLSRFRDAAARARQQGADVLVLPELALSGYPPMDLLHRPGFLRQQNEALDALGLEARDGLAIVAGAILEAPAGSVRKLSNAAVAWVDGRVAHVQAKTLLPTYDVFDEARYFAPASERVPWTYQGRRIGLAICEDAWSGAFWGDERPYPCDPVEELADAGAELLLAVSASPWEQGKIALREDMIQHASHDHGLPCVFANLLGGNDELVFDGSSFATAADGSIVYRLARFEEDFGVIDPFDPPAALPEDPGDDRVELLQKAIVLGIRDYLGKLQLDKVVIAISGGIDSAVTADLAVRAIGPEKVLGILMPGPFSSEHSVTDAEALANNLGIEHRIVRIDSIYKSFLEQFRVLFGPAESYGLTQENLQARVRGTLLMACSNYEDRIVLATGNKSELSVGYTTLYGDLVGGIAVLGDVLKRDVYALARLANRDGPRIPLGTIEKPPSAELAPDQRDTDSLPDYDVLDEILASAIERREPVAEIPVPEGATQETVDWVLRAIDRNEYKRRQAPLILRVTGKAFGIGRRLPIVHKSGWGR